MGIQSVQFVERIIAQRVAEVLIEKFGKVTIDFDGESEVECKSVEELTSNMSDCDQEYLHVSWTEESEINQDGETFTETHIRHGWVRMIYGNGEDVISDHTTNLEAVLAPIFQWIDPEYKSL